jgi:hypothetical protein
MGAPTAFKHFSLDPNSFNPRRQSVSEIRAEAAYLELRGMGWVLPLTRSAPVDARALPWRIYRFIKGVEQPFGIEEAFRSYPGTAPCPCGRDTSFQVCCRDGWLAAR